jgi:poly(A) polymerase
MKHPPDILKQDFMREVISLSKKRNSQIYLVGGFLRDAIVGRKKDILDLDFAVDKDAIGLARQFANKTKSGFVVLDKEHGCARVIYKGYTLDFTDFRGKDLEDDLRHRDFTVNAMALELEKIFSKEDLNNLLVDPYGAVKDLRAKIIRVVARKAFDEDPLRMLRAFSLACIFGFGIDKETIKLIKEKKEKLSGISFERIRDELFKIFDQPDSYDYLVKLDELGILKVIIPEIEIMRGVKQGPYHHLDVWKHTLETVKQADILIKELKKNQEIQSYLNEVISSDRRRRALIKLGALLHDIGKPQARHREDGKTKFHGHERIGLEITKNIAGRLKLSNDELDSLQKMVFWHLRPGYLADNEELSPRAKFRYFRDTAQEGVSTLLLSIADQRSTKGPLTSEESRIQHEKVASGLIKGYFIKKKQKQLARLINGDDLIRKFKLTPSPLFGKILTEIEELQAIGKIKTKKQALKAARKFIK